MKEFKADNGQILIARDEVQEAALKNQGLKEVKAKK